MSWRLIAPTFPYPPFLNFTDNFKIGSCITEGKEQELIFLGKVRISDQNSALALSFGMLQEKYF